MQSVEMRQFGAFQVTQRAENLRVFYATGSKQEVCVDQAARSAPPASLRFSLGGRQREADLVHLDLVHHAHLVHAGQRADTLPERE